MSTPKKTRKGKQYMAELTGRRWKDGDNWFAEINKLPVASFGNNPDEAMRRLMATLNAYLESCFKDKELTKAMRYHDLIVDRQNAEYKICVETPVGAQESDLVLT